LAGTWLGNKLAIVEQPGVTGGNQVRQDTSRASEGTGMSPGTNICASIRAPGPTPLPCAAEPALMNPSSLPAPADRHTMIYRPPAEADWPTQVIYQDEALLAIHKPAGLLSVPGRGAERADCALARVQARVAGDALIVHRLDMGTSGLLLLARGADMQRQLSMAFASRQVHKSYVALVSGHLKDDAGEVALPLICDWPQRPRQKVDLTTGKPALTRWQVLERGHAETPRGLPWTRVRLEPVTGRSHQLRVHMESLGHPILGDELYAPPLLAQACPRLMLHAQELRLQHPVHEQTLVLHCAAPF
jgi:tRNA pseudouridine32 synthase/23S rRNA pseudouridine746 synthase